jgi:hypothetical protein
MTNELEKQFFDTFGIEPNVISAPNYHWEDYVMRYPQITDRILLELILIDMHNEDLFGYPTSIQELKDNTLKQLIETYNKFSTCVTCDGEYQQSARDIKHQVRTLFEEE